MDKKPDKTESNIFNFIKKHSPMAGEKIIDEFDLSGTEYELLLLEKLKNTLGLIKFSERSVYLSEKGESFDSFESYQESNKHKKPKTPIFKIISAISTILLVLISYLSYNLKENQSLTTIENLKLTKSIDSLKVESGVYKDSIVHLKEQVYICN